jgi:hypothetical protein
METESFCLSINVGVSITLVFSFHLVKPWSFHWLVWKCCRTVTHLRSLLKYTIREEQITLHRHVKLSRTSFMLQCRGWEWMVHLKEEDNEARIKVISVGFDNWFCRPYLFLWCDGGEVEGGPPYVVCYYGWDTPCLSSWSFLSFLLMQTPPCFKRLVWYSHDIQLQGNLAAVHKKILTRGLYTGV